jgi:hypothetical protein
MVLASALLFLLEWDRFDKPDALGPLGLRNAEATGATCHFQLVQLVPKSLRRTGTLQHRVDQLYPVITDSYIIQLSTIVWGVKF